MFKKIDNNEFKENAEKNVVCSYEARDNMVSAIDMYELTEFYQTLCKKYADFNAKIFVSRTEPKFKEFTNKNSVLSCDFIASVEFKKNGRLTHTEVKKPINFIIEPNGLLQLENQDLETIVNALKIDFAFIMQVPKEMLQDGKTNRMLTDYVDLIDKSQNFENTHLANGTRFYLNESKSKAQGKGI